MAGTEESPCRFGARRLSPRIRAFAKEIEGVREGTDPRSVHRMRVASRRLRSALPIFACCFRKSEVRGWMKGLKGVTRALGEARDTDVRLAFLGDYLRGLPEGSIESAGIGRVLSMLSNNRKQEQESIIAALDALEDADLVSGISAGIRNAGKSRQGRDAGRETQRQIQVTLPEIAAANISSAFCDLLSFGPSVSKPSDVQGHHALRISAKRLRYTLEVFRPLSPDRLRPAIQQLRHLQDLLGQIHDCDVWISLLSGITGSKKGRARSGEPSLPGPPLSPAEAAGISRLLGDRRSARRDLYRQLVLEWEGPGLLSLEERLIPAFGTAGPESGGPGTDAGRHARQVAGLSLRLFDALAPLHGYGAKERRLLGYAAALHDTGLAFGEKGHHARSYRMILSDRSLPVSPRERAIVALVARYHRKTVPDKPGRPFSGLSGKDRQRVLSLASILRIADGLDYTHAGRVVSITCTVSEDAVTCVPVYCGDGGTERERARAKADLFERVFRHRFVIP